MTNEENLKQVWEEAELVMNDNQLDLMKQLEILVYQQTIKQIENSYEVASRGK